MSAFLGPVHFMLYNKIQRQNDLLNEIIKASDENKWVDDLAGKLKESCGENETAPLETVIDEKRACISGHCGPDALRMP